eukprot:SM000014S00316  [mRNA]  locus=s14:662330:669236:- [translate_table: standard]
MAEASPAIPAPCEPPEPNAEHPPWPGSHLAAARTAVTAATSKAKRKRHMPKVAATHITTSPLATAQLQKLQGSSRLAMEGGATARRPPTWYGHRKDTCGCVICQQGRGEWTPERAAERRTASRRRREERALAKQQASSAASASNVVPAAPDEWQPAAAPAAGSDASPASVTVIPKDAGPAVVLPLALLPPEAVLADGTKFWSELIAASFAWAYAHLRSSLLPLPPSLPLALTPVSPPPCNDNCSSACGKDDFVVRLALVPVTPLRSSTLLAPRKVAVRILEDVPALLGGVRVGRPIELLPYTDSWARLNASRGELQAKARRFIACMHIVQGDRSFSPWKGSVVDAVVGAFLTQNVNDTFSAFMSLAARFPPSGHHTSGNRCCSRGDGGGGKGRSCEDMPSLRCPYLNIAMCDCWQEGGSSSRTVPVAAATDSECHKASGDAQQSTWPCGPSEDIIGEAVGLPTDTLACRPLGMEAPGMAVAGAAQLANMRECPSPQPADAIAAPAAAEVVGAARSPAALGEPALVMPAPQLTGMARARHEFSEGGHRGARRDWEAARRAAATSTASGPPAPPSDDKVDWAAVMVADLADLADAIKERGMQFSLAGRIKALLTRLHAEHGSIDLEWLRLMRPEDAQDFLVSIRGLGLKSTECIRLLTLHHLAFPVQCELCLLSFPLLLTLLKVLPLPLRLVLTCNEALVPAQVKVDTNVGRICTRLGWVPLEPLPEELQLHLLELYPVQASIQRYLWPRLSTLDQRTLYELHYQMITFGKPIIEEPVLPRACFNAGDEADIEDMWQEAGNGDDDPPLEVVVEGWGLVTVPAGQAGPPAAETVTGFAANVHSSASNWAGLADRADGVLSQAVPRVMEHGQSTSHETNVHSLYNELHGGVSCGAQSLALVPLEDLAFPLPKLKDVHRLRSIHHVYELPDDSPVVATMEAREVDDPSPYLLVIWGPGKAVFADDLTSNEPLKVPRALLWRLRRRLVYFGSSATSIFRGLTSEEISAAFTEGYVCVRGFDSRTKAPKALSKRLHMLAAVSKRGAGCRAGKATDALELKIATSGSH